MTEYVCGFAFDNTKQYVTLIEKKRPNWQAGYLNGVGGHIEEGEVPFERNEVPVGTDHTSLRKEWKNLYHFVKGGNDTLSKTRRESMFIQILEGLHPDEADILCLVKDKNLTDKYKISKTVVETAFPDIKWGDRS